MPWTALFHLGDLTLTLPVAGGIAVWLLFARSRRAALGWSVLFGLALAAVAGSKIAFLGWHTGVPALRFHALSGHATGFTAVFPTACGLLAQRHGRTARYAAVGLGLGMGVLVAVALVGAHQHTPAEAAAGWALGAATCLLGLRLSRQPTAASALPISGGAPPAAVVAAIVVATITAWAIQFLPFGVWMIKTALVLSGRTHPFSWGRC